MEAPLPDWPRLRDYLLAQPGWRRLAPSFAWTACWSTRLRPQGVQLRAVLPELEANLSDAGNFMTGRGLRELQAANTGSSSAKIIADKLGSRQGTPSPLLPPLGGRCRRHQEPETGGAHRGGLLETAASPTACSAS